VRRIRLVVAGLAIALVVPIGLLVHRAVQSTALERELRHRTIAERVFDEMERALSDFLKQEEERPFERYAETDPASPFVLGYFEVAPDGRADVRTRSGASGVRAAIEGATNEIRGGEASHRDTPLAQIAGTTVRLAEGAAAKPAAPAALDDEREQRQEREAPAYDALRSLNKAATQRAERQKTMAADAVSEEKDLAKSEFREDAPAGRAAEPPVAKDKDAAGLPPMTGRALDADRLLLVRTVVRGAEAYRQGLVLDVARLATFLRAAALGDAVLATHASVSFATRFASDPAPVADFTYQHRFADPFEAMSARLALRALPGTGAAGYVYALSGALLVAAMLGLVALYRMVAVAVAFAERRSNFVAAVTHELKTPLTAIRMYGEMLRDGIVPSDAKRQEYYRHITAESERLSRLINNVLEFSRLEKGTRDVALVTGALAPVVQEAIELVRPHAEAEGFTLGVEIDGGLPPVRFERDALLQVLFNLVDNAVKYARDGGERRIVVRAAPSDGGVRLAVRDAGPGVPERHLPHVFEPFYRGERELTRRSRGTGLGLALVRGLVERMGGRVDGRNVPGGGFEVTITLADPRLRLGSG
jgi:signal transduction histidine kinase